MSQSHSHSHGTEDVGDTVLLWTVVVNLLLSVFEFVAGLLSGSVALMADALHNTNDAGALLIAYIARKISRKGADEKYTFGYQRAELIGAMIQLTALIIVGLYLVYEAVRRFFAPEPLLGGWIMAAAGFALMVDVITAWLLWSMTKGSLNVKAAFLHNLADASASVAVLLGGAVIYWIGWNWVDPIVTLIIASYILWMSWGMLIKTSSILMQAVPEGIDLVELETLITELEGVIEIHDLHVWSLDENIRALQSHIVIEDSELDQLESIKQRIKNALSIRFEINHTVLEFETISHICGANG